MKQKKKSRFLKIFGFVILILVIVLGVFVAANFNSVKALVKGLMHDTDKIGNDLAQNQKDTADALTNAGISVSHEDFEKVNDGTLSPEEITDILLNGMGQHKDDAQVPKLPEENKETEEIPSVQPTETIPKQEGGEPVTPVVPESPEPKPEPKPKPKPEPKPEPKPTPKPEDSEQAYNKRVAELVAQMYVIKADFMAQLNEFETRIKSEYAALPKEQHTAATKAKIVSDNMGYVAGLEAQCDAQVKAVTDELTELLKAHGQDTVLVDSIKAAYENEKELKKAYYISLYK